VIITQRLGTKLQAEQKLFHRQIVIEGSNTQLGFILAFTWTLTIKHFSKYAFMTKCMLQAADLIECREQLQIRRNQSFVRNSYSPCGADWQKHS